MASLISARMELDNPKVEATGVQASGKARSSVEMKDSCNCCKFCFPCFGKKEKKDARKERDRRSVEIMRTVQKLQADIYSEPGHTIVRSPRSDNPVDTQSVNVTINIDTHPSLPCPFTEMPSNPLNDSNSSRVNQ